jgi:hypothetical protein
VKVNGKKIAVLVVILAVLAGVGAGVGGAATVGSFVRNIYHNQEEIWRARRIIRAGSPYFLTTIPSSKGVALPSDFN